MVKSSRCSCRRSEFGSQHLHNSLQLSRTPAQGTQRPLRTSKGQAPTQCEHICTGKAIIGIQISKLLKKSVYMNVYTCPGTCVRVRGKREIFSFHCESWGLNPGSQAWWLLSLSIEPPTSPVTKLLNRVVMSQKGDDEPERLMT